MFYIVDKPLGISSNLVAKILKRVLNKKKIGFAGTLDPLASGLMIIGTDGSSRLFPLLDGFSKTYETTIRLDGTTSSYDLEQPVEKIEINKEVQKKITQKYLEEVIGKNFTGDIMQSPPKYSAVWINGQRAYELARKGREMEEIEAKKRTIHELRIISYEWPRVHCEISVSHGTYIRSIARDLGLMLGTGGYIEALRRVKIGHINLDKDSWTHHNDISYKTLSHEKLFPEIAVLDFSPEEKTHLRLGSTPILTNKKNGYYFVDYENETYGLLEAKEGEIFPVKNVV